VAKANLVSCSGWDKSPRQAYIRVTGNLKSVDTQVIEEACTGVLFVRLELDVVMFAIHSNQLSTPESIDDTLGFRRA
jgi:hypothetical protein